MVDQNVICNIVEIKEKKSLVILLAFKLLLGQGENHVVPQFKRCFRYLGMRKNIILSYCRGHTGISNKILALNLEV